MTPRAACLALAAAVGLTAAACSEFSVSPTGAASGGGMGESSSAGSTSAGIGPTCADGEKDGDETDVDCGGEACSACAASAACRLARDCASGLCVDGRCAAPNCADAAKNGGETDVDCGGPCPPCADGLACLAAADCLSQTCAAGACAPSTCSNGAHDPGETGVDCGGRCRPCPLGTACNVTADCITGSCVHQVCEAPRGVWVEVPAASPPSARFQHGMMYDPVRHGVLLYGGKDLGAYLDDTYLYDGAAWTLVAATGPGARAFPALIPAEDGATPLVFGGFDGATFRTDTATLDAAGLWTTAAAQANPLFGRIGVHAGFAVYPFVFGGFGPADAMATSPTVLGDVWLRLAGVWTYVGAGPTPRLGGAVATFVGGAYLFGGSPDQAGSLDDMWRLDGTTLAWSLLPTPTRPPARLYGALGFDPVRGRAVLFGGVATTAPVDPDTWEFDGATWAVTTSDGPPPRASSAMAWDVDRRRLVLFGGSDAAGQTAKADTWEYHVTGNGCDETAPCDTGYCVDGLCCESAACGPCEACNLPLSAGTCAPVINGPDPDSCPGGACDDHGTCQ